MSEWRNEAGRIFFFFNHAGMKISRTLLFIAPSKSAEAPERRHGFAHLWKKKKEKKIPPQLLCRNTLFKKPPPPAPKSTHRARIVSRLFPRLQNPSRKWACERIIAPVRHLSPASIHRSKSAPMKKTPRKKMREKMRERPPPRNTMRLRGAEISPP